MKAVWLNGGLTHPGAAAVSIDSPLVRWGDALFETMRADDGRVRFRERHLARIAASATTLGIELPSARELERAIDAACAACGAPHQRVRLTAGEGLVMVEADDAEPLGAAAVATAAVIRGAWIPEHPLAGHKSTSYGAYRIAARQAAKRGAQIALLADDQGRLGEADTGNVVAVVDGELLTPARGVLPGIARAALIGAGLVRQAELGPEVLERSSELLMTNALRGVVALRSVEGEPWSRDTPGPRAEAAMQAFRRLG